MNIFKNKKVGLYLLIDLRSTLPENEKRIKLITNDLMSLKVIYPYHKNKSVVFIYDLVNSDKNIDLLIKANLIFPHLPSEWKKQLYEEKFLKVSWEDFKKFII